MHAGCRIFTAQVHFVVIDRPAIKMLSAALLVTSFPGPQHLHPTVHYARGLVSQQGGWHDIAGAITSKGVHHIFQGTVGTTLLRKTRPPAA